MWKKLLGNLIDPAVNENLSQFSDRLGSILAAQERLKTLSDDDLKRVELGDRCSVFAVVGEVASRVLDMRPYPVQILAGLALSEGRLVEMQTGEGKTLVATMPAIEHGLSGLGCHVLTSNDYLAQRDAQWMAPIYRFMGLSVGFVRKTSTWEERQLAYGCDVTYATATEAGFDYLRTQLCMDIDSRLQSKLTHVIVDEADSILIDEARVPLVVAGPACQPKQDRKQIEVLVDSFHDDFWEIDSHARNVCLTEAGASWVEAELQCDSLYDLTNSATLTLINQALHAHHLLRPDIDYLVRDDRIEIIDECSGRVAPDRRWPDGLHAAIEAKEGVSIRDDGRVLGTITLQNYIRQYSHISGMTATAREDAEELHRVYGTIVVPIPPNKPCIRIDHPDLVFTHAAAKRTAIMEEIIREHETGRPVLVGTASVGESDSIANEVRLRGLICHVLNAANDDAEAAIIAEAGSPSAITISTNMAGRGTDIRLGGTKEHHRKELLLLGGLHVVGTNRFESTRIDRQLRGRAGRQGDQGSSRFIVSLEDDLMLRFGLQESVPKSQYPERSQQPVEDPNILHAVEHLQRRVSGQNAEIRTTLLKYSQLLEAQRRITVDWRDQIISDGASYIDDCQNHRALRNQFDAEVLAKIERELLLKHIDDCWAEHLEIVADVREGIHLTIKTTDIGGLDPYVSYRMQIGRAYWTLRTKAIERLITDLEHNEFDIEARHIGRPSGTWTYLINDQFFDEYRQSLFNHSENGTGSYTVIITWPFIRLWALWKKVTRRD